MTDAPDKPARLPPGRHLHLLAFVSFVICAAAWLGSLFGVAFLQNARWLEALLLLLALAATLLSQARALPLQNVLAAAAVIALISGVALLINAHTGIPFGPVVYPDTMRPLLFGLLPWSVPLIWVVAILNSRAVARLILRPWRKLSKYGFWLFGLTCLLSVLFDFALEPFASAATTHWIWRTPPNSLAWHSAPWSNFLGWMVTAVLILGFTTPWLINKKSSRHSTPDYQPLLLWLVVMILLAVGSAAHQLWSAAAFDLLAAVIVACFAVRGARW
jgi:uncharacterized membrane protein